MYFVTSKLKPVALIGFQLQWTFFNLASLFVSLFKQHKDAHLKIKQQKTKLKPYFFLVCFYRPAEVAAPQDLQSSWRWLQVEEKEVVKVCGALRCRRKEEEGREPAAALNEVGEILSQNCSHRATNFPQATLRVVGPWKFSVVVTVRKRPAATVRSHVGGANTCHLKWQTFTFFLWRERKKEGFNLLQDFWCWNSFWHTAGDF